MGTYSFHKAIIYPLDRLRDVLDQKYPKIQAQQINDPHLLFGSKALRKHRVAHVKWVANEAACCVATVRFADAARKRRLAMRLASETGLISPEEIDYIECPYQEAGHA